MSPALPSSCAALLLTRAWVRRDAVADFDAWQEARHIPELIGLPGIERAAYYASVEADVPQVLVGSGNRTVAYWGRDLPELLGGLTHPGLAAAVADGSRFFPAFNELDGDVYTGNIYLVDPPIGDDEGDPGALLVERFEVPVDTTASFETWLADVHVPGLQRVPSVGSVRVGRAVRRDLPIPYYNSRGSHAVIVGLDDDSAGWTSNGLVAHLGGSQQWDRALTYVRREVGRLRFSRSKGGG